MTTGTEEVVDSVMEAGRATSDDESALLSPQQNGGARRASMISWTKRTIVGMPLLVLVIFGFIHLVLVIAGGSRFYWDIDDDSLLPSWGLPGYIDSRLSRQSANLTRDVPPVPVHSHNDYWRRVPLFDALSWGCASVEADVWVFDNDEEVYIGHNRRSLTRERTFRKLYVNPIVDLIDGMNDIDEVLGRRSDNKTWRGVFDQEPGRTLVLLVDLKTDSPSTLSAVSSQLSALRTKDHLTNWNGTHLNTRAVTVVASGKVPVDTIVAAHPYRDIFIDAPLDNLASQPLFDSSNSYYASASFRKAVGNVWNGRLSSRQMQVIRDHVSVAHARGLRARYWDTPAWPINLRNYIWDVLVWEGADVLNADDLRAAAVVNWERRVHGLWY